MLACERKQRHETSAFNRTLLLNERVRKRARLGNNLTLVGVRDHIELWDTDNWEQYLSDNMTQYQNQMMQARQTVLQKQSKDMDL